MHRVAFCGALAVALTTAADAGATDTTFSLAVHVASDAGIVAQDDAWIDAQIGRAEQLFAPVGVHFKRATARALPDRFAHLETRADRDGLASELDRGKINVMIVASLRDVDDQRLYRQGVHWRPAGATGKHFVIVSASAGSTTLAHELGHFFGNGHTTLQNNLMSYDRTGDQVFLTDAQKKTIGVFTGIYLRSKELVPE